MDSRAVFRVTAYATVEEDSEMYYSSLDSALDQYDALLKHPKLQEYYSKIVVMIIVLKKDVTPVMFLNSVEATFAEQVVMLREWTHVRT